MASENVYPGDKHFELGKTDIGGLRYASGKRQYDDSMMTVWVRKGLTRYEPKKKYSSKNNDT